MVTMSSDDAGERSSMLPRSGSSKVSAVGVEVGAAVGFAVGAGGGESPEDHGNANVPRPVENASTMKYVVCVDP
jgi:hypothetical protein